MGYQIEACIENGKPNLKIYDMTQGDLCLDWHFDGDLASDQTKQEVHHLFRQLLLLTCKQELRNIRLFELKNYLPNKNTALSTIL